jgi:putative membrane protein
VSDRLVLSVIAVVSAAVLAGIGVLLLGGQARGGALDVSGLPALNACLNGISAGLLAAGFAFIRRRRVGAHLACMTGALGVSALFLVSYVIYHYHAGSRPFTGQGWIRPLYFFFLLTHIVLAATIVPLALVTIYRGLTGYRALSSASAAAPALARHVRIARWTLPVWLYVSVTGVLIYWMLYRL